MTHTIDIGRPVRRGEPEKVPTPIDGGRGGGERPSALERWGRFCARRHWPVIVAWLVILVAVGAFHQAHHGVTKDKFAIPGTQSQKATDLLASEFPAASGPSATVVFEVTSGSLADPNHKAAIDQTVTNLKGLPQVTSVTGPFDPTPTGIQGFDQGHAVVTTENLNVNAQQTIGFATVPFSEQLSVDRAKATFTELEKATRPAVDAGLKVNMGGQVVDLGNPPDPGLSKYAEPIGLVFALIILIVALGSFPSMAVPIGVALISVVLSELLVGILEASFSIGAVAPILGAMIGLGVGIDYSLFIVSRYRQGLTEGMEPYDAVGRSIATSGSAVLFAGITVCMALCGLYFVGIPYVAQLGYIASLFVGVTIAAALTLVPALLGLLGHRINSLSIHHHHETADIHKTLSARWASATSNHPLRYALISLVILLLLAAPVLKIELGFTDDGNAATQLTQRRAYDTLTANFGAGVNGPLLLAVDLRGADLTNQQTVSDGFVALGRLTDAIKATPGVARVSLPVPNNVPTAQDPKLPTALIMQIVPTTAPNSEATANLVRNLHGNVIPTSLKGTTGDANKVYIGGQTSTLIDLTDALTSRLPIFIGAVLLGAFLLLMMVFRSLFVPFKAAVMNLLSIGGAYGVIVLVFQEGWGKGLIGLSGTVPIVAFVPVIMFAVLFGLSMDYEVFLISRIKEEYEKSGDSRQSVVTGLAATARVITAAALIMIAVFLSFVTNPDPTVKMIGLGMAVAVFIDATIVRMMLVPSTMELAGKANWWLPAWLDRVLPHIHVE
ncbi:MAG: MMPL family transporter [Actinomycetota bacterium]|nr:MMPL family transporter [Actinomycetota bacterium]